MSRTFQNPRNPLAAVWASAAEMHLRENNPDLSIQEIRRLPFMQGVYEHLSHLKEKRRVPQPPNERVDEDSDSDLRIEQAAYLSQSFFDLAMTMTACSTAAKVDPANLTYEAYIILLESTHFLDRVTNFSTKDWMGFALCVIVYVWIVGSEELAKELTEYELAMLDFILRNAPVTQEQRDAIKEFWATPMDLGSSGDQYRDSRDEAYRDYGVLDWTIPDDAQIVMLGDWGTSMDDAKEFLKAIWKQAYLNKPGAPIVFIHLGDIYYCGLPQECYYNFQDVFTLVAEELNEDLKYPGNFDPNPRIFTIPGNHEYYSFGCGYYALLDNLGHNQRCSYFCLRTSNGRWQFLGMDTGQDDGNGIESALQAAGETAMKIFKVLPNLSWIKWIENLAVSTYEDHVGPFEPKLRDSEVDWLKDKMNGFSGKTIMLSHHQLFSRQAEINHNSPEYKNSWLYSTFYDYLDDHIAAWYWGHEHTFAVYVDGLMGLNKGRLLGSSSYEVTEGSDHPYKKNYPRVAFAPNMNENLIEKHGDYFNHAGAIMHQDGSDIKVRYYQFPSWSQLNTSPPPKNLTEIREVAERINTHFTSLKFSWIGDTKIKEDLVTTEHSPAITVWDNKFYMVYTNKDRTLALASIAKEDFGMESGVLKADWSQVEPVQMNGSSIETNHSPTVVAINGSLYGFYVDKDEVLQGITRPASLGADWTTLNLYRGQSLLKVGNAAPAIGFFQGRIYVVYREKGSSNNLCWGFYDVTTGGWQDFGKLMDKKGDNIESDGTPALAADVYRMHLTYQKKDGSVIRWAVATPDSPVPDGLSNNIVWEKQGNISDEPYTQTGMSLANADGTFIMVYTSTNGNLTPCFLTQSSKDKAGFWVKGETLHANQRFQDGETDTGSTLRSKYSPGLAITKGVGLLVYRGLDHDEIYWSYF